MLGLSEANRLAEADLQLGDVKRRHNAQHLQLAIGCAVRVRLIAGRAHLYEFGIGSGVPLAKQMCVCVFEKLTPQLDARSPRIDVQTDDGLHFGQFNANAVQVEVDVLLQSGAVGLNDLLGAEAQVQNLQKTNNYQWSKSNI